MDDSRGVAHYKKMMETPIPKLILGLSVPTIITMMVTNIYNLVDTAFVGSLGNSASGAVGVVFGFMAILQAIGFTFGQGSGSIISRALGKKEYDRVSVIASTGFITAFALAVVTGIVCFFVLDDLVMLLGSTETIAPYAKTYILYIIMTAPFMVTSYTLNNLLRYEGKAAFGMVGLLTGAILNIAGDALFMFVFHMGIAGAGLSTAISQVIGFGILLSMFLRGKTQCRISFRFYRLDMRLIGDIVLTGMPSMLRQGLNSVATIMLNNAAGVYGDPAVAAMSIVSRIMFFVFSVGIGIGQGFQPVSGFLYGAKKYERLRKAFRFTFIAAECVILGVAIVAFIGAGAFVRLFRNDDEVVQIATRALRLQCAAQIFLPFCIVTEMLMQTTGQKLFASLLSLFRSGLLFIPALLILSQVRGLAGIQEAQPIAFILAIIPALFFSIRFFKKLPKGDLL